MIFLQVFTAILLLISKLINVQSISDVLLLSVIIPPEIAPGCGLLGDVLIPLDDIQTKELKNGTVVNMITLKPKLWPNGKVPYVIVANLTSSSDLIHASMHKIHNKTCVRFVPRTTQTNYIQLFKGSGCYSNLGKIGGKQMLSLGPDCYRQGTITHEIIHSIGFYNLQDESNGSDSVKIYWKDIPGVPPIQSAGIGPKLSKSVINAINERYKC